MLEMNTNSLHNGPLKMIVHTVFLYPITELFTFLFYTCLMLSLKLCYYTCNYRRMATAMGGIGFFLFFQAGFFVSFLPKAHLGAITF